MRIHRYPSIPNIYEITKIPNVGKRYDYGAWTSTELEALRNNNWIGTEKIDGTNIRVGWDGDTTVTFHGREHKDGNLPPDTTGIPQLLKNTFTVEKFTTLYPGKPLTLYTEAYGPGIANLGRLYGTEPAIRVFDVRINDVWLEPRNVNDIAAALGTHTSPRRHYGPLTEAFIRVAGGLTSTFGPFPAEGLIMTTANGLLNRKGERLQCKIKYEYIAGDNAWRPHMKKANKK